MERYGQFDSILRDLNVMTAERNQLKTDVARLETENVRLQMENAELESDREAWVAEALAHDCRQSDTPNEVER